MNTNITFGQFYNSGVITYAKATLRSIVAAIVMLGITIAIAGAMVAVSVDNAQQLWQHASAAIFMTGIAAIAISLEDAKEAYWRLEKYQAVVYGLVYTTAWVAALVYLFGQMSEKV